MVLFPSRLKGSATGAGAQTQNRVVPFALCVSSRKDESWGRAWVNCIAKLTMSVVARQNKQHSQVLCGLHQVGVAGMIGNYAYLH